VRNGENSNVEEQNGDLGQAQAENPEELKRKDELLARLWLVSIEGFVNFVIIRTDLEEESDRLRAVSHHHFRHMSPSDASSEHSRDANSLQRDSQDLEPGILAKSSQTLP